MNPSRIRVAAVPLALVLSAGALLAACGSDSDDKAASTTTEAAAAATTTVPAEAEITISGQWARTSPKMTSAGAAYMEITNGTDADDALTGASVDASIAGTVEVHETTMAEDGDEGMHGDGDADMQEDGDMAATTEMDGDMTATTEAHGEGGMMSMKPVDEIPIAAGETVVLEPGGYHIMLLDLVEPLKTGDTFEITLTFAEAGDMVIEVEVLDTAP